MSKIILVVFMLVNRNEVYVEYAVKYPTEQACLQAKAALRRDPPAGVRIVGESLPLKRAACVMEVKA